MEKKKIKIIFPGFCGRALFKAVAVFALVLLSFSFCRAETIVLKTGKEIQGKILEKNKDGVKIEIYDIPITYFWDQIATIDGQTPPSSTPPQTLSEQPSSEKDKAVAGQPPSKTSTPPESSGSGNIVSIKNRQLWVRKRLPDGSLEQPKLFVIKGISWSPATAAPDIGPNPLNPLEHVDYGFFFDWEGRNPQGHDVFIYWIRNQFFVCHKEDIPLLKKMRVNTVRVYTDFGLNFNIYKSILDEFYNNDIMVIVTVSASRDDIDNRRYLNVVSVYKNHPAILMWSLGNEWNLDYNKFWGYATVTEAAEAVNRVAAEIKGIDPNHPVCSVLGDRFYDPEPANTIEATLKICSNVDAWGINVYRGASFGNIFSQWQQISSKPFFISEFGTDSFRTDSYELTPERKAYNCQGREDEEMQARFASSLYKELKSHLSAFQEKESCLGGLVHEFNDELWKVGSYHALLGGLVNYEDQQQKHSYVRYDTAGAYMKGAHPDDVANEEYFGVVDANRKPKKAYYEIQRLYGG